jgi:tungstate transport system ATP-binding protein
MTAVLPVIEGRGLRIVRGGSVIVDIPSFIVEEGEVLSLIGPNGAGKTTLLQALSLLLKPFEGDLLFRGRKVGPACPVLTYRRALAMVFQEPLLFDTTVFENVASGLRIRGLKRTQIRGVVMESLALFGISGLKDRSARSLSGGEAQRVSLARALAVRPDVMLLDEPFASLDPRSREPLIEDMQAILRTTKTTTVLVTHDLAEALRLSDRIAVMTRGAIRQTGSPEDVMNAPMDEFVASFLGIGTILKGKVRESAADSAVVSVSGRDVESAGHFRAGETVALCIRPENIVLSVVSEGFSEAGPGGGNVFSCTVTGVTSMGRSHRITLDCGFPLVTYVSARSREDLGLMEGRRVTASFTALAVRAVEET